MVEQKKLILGVAVIQLSDLKKVDVVAGSSNVNITPEIPFSEMSVDFLEELSNVLRKSAESKIRQFVVFYSS